MHKNKIPQIYSYNNEKLYGHLSDNSSTKNYAGEPGNGLPRRQRKISHIQKVKYALFLYSICIPDYLFKACYQNQNDSC